MPNWCSNSVVLKHKDPTFVARAREAFNEGTLLNEFIPVPKDLKETVSGFMGDADEQKQLEIQTAYNIKNYGYGNWYDFCVNEWGTKWDVGADGQPAQDIEGGFVGEWIDGEDYCYQIEGNSEWVRENIPEHLDEAFAISEGMEQWEEEANEEES